MRQLTQLEKRLLIILALQKQLQETGAEGDFTKTITSTSNRLKQISETFKEISRWAGELMLVFINPFVEKVLVASIALKEMLKSLAYAQGYKMPDFGIVKKQTEDASENVDNILETTEQIKNLLLGFDKLNVLGSTNQSGEISDDLDLIYGAMGSYSSAFEKVESNVNDTVKGLMEWLGFTQQIKVHTLETGEEIEQVVWALKDGETNFSKIIGGVTSALATIASIGILKKVKDLFALIAGEGGILSAIGKIVSKFNIWYALIVAVVASFADLYATNEEFSNSINESFGRIGENLKTIFNNIKTLFQKFAETEFFKFFKEHLAYTLKVVVDVIDALTSLLAGDWDGLGKSLKTLFDDLWDGVTGNFAKALNEILQFVVDLLEKLWDLLQTYVFKPIGNFFSNLWEDIVTGFKNAWESVSNWVKDVAKTIGNFFINMINSVIEGFEQFLNFFIRGINEITGALSNAWTWLGIPEIKQIKEVSFEGIPALANGGVITQPTMAMVGEYNGASTNPEIVTPENKMREVFIESMLPIAQAIVNGDQQVIQAINGLSNRPIELNGRKVSEEIYSDLQDVANRKGESFSFIK